MAEKQYWLDRRKNVKKVLRVLYAICAGLLAIDLFYQRKAEVSWEGWFGFYAFYGFVACVALVLIAKEMRKFVMRKPDYYDD